MCFWYDDKDEAQGAGMVEFGPSWVSPGTEVELGILIFEGNVLVM
jgi:hypothetical protein